MRSLLLLCIAPLAGRLPREDVRPCDAYVPSRPRRQAVRDLSTRISPAWLLPTMPSISPSRWRDRSSTVPVAQGAGVQRGELLAELDPRDMSCRSMPAARPSSRPAPTSSACSGCSNTAPSRSRSTRPRDHYVQARSTLREHARPVGGHPSERPVHQRRRARSTSIITNACRPDKRFSGWWGPHHDRPVHAAQNALRLAGQPRTSFTSSSTTTGA